MQENQIYAITHLTLYHYDKPITDSVMELRMNPRSEANQRCARFDLDLSPTTKVMSYDDYLGNTVHTFTVSGEHTELAIKSEAVVELKAKNDLPLSLPESAWDEIDAQIYDRDLYDMIMPSKYAKTTPLLEQFAAEFDWRRRSDPLSLLHELNTYIFDSFEYKQHVTRADSPIDVALNARLGVCQDFAHIMIAMGRNLGIPCRYVSGYLYHHKDKLDRSDVDASHAWMEAWLPGLGWVGFDPTNNLIANDRHIRVGVAMDYSGASPSRGVFKGNAKTRLEVRVQVSKLGELPLKDADLAPEIVMPHYEYHQQVQQQQQQQQQ